MATSDGPGVLPNLPTSPMARTVEVEEDKFLMLVHKLRSQDSRLMAYSNLHLLLFEKQKELEEKEKQIKQYEALYSLAQCQIQKLAYSNAHATILPSVEIIETTSQSKGGEVHESFAPVQIHHLDIESDSPVAEHHEVTVSVSDEHQDSSSSLQENVTYEKEPVARLVSVEFDRTMGFEVTGSGVKSRGIVGRGLVTRHNEDGDANTNIDSQPVRTTSLQSIQTSTIDPCVDMPNSLPPVLPYITGVSKTVFDNVVKENIKLKKMLQDLFDKVNNDNKEKEKGIQDLLDVQEYRDVVRQLQMVIVEKQQKINELRADMLAHEKGDVEGLTAKNLKLMEHVDQAKKQLQSKQELLESYIQAYEKLKQETASNQAEGNAASLPLASGLPSGIPATVHAVAKEHRGSGVAEQQEILARENETLRQEVKELREKEFAYKEQLKEFGYYNKERNSWKSKKKKVPTATLR